MVNGRSMYTVVTFPSRPASCLTTFSHVQTYHILIHRTPRAQNRYSDMACVLCVPPSSYHRLSYHKSLPRFRWGAWRVRWACSQTSHESLLSVVSTPPKQQIRWTRPRYHALSWHRRGAITWTCMPRCHALDGQSRGSNTAHYTAGVRPTPQTS